MLESHTSRTTRVRENEREARKREAKLSTVFKSWPCFLTNHAETTDPLSKRGHGSSAGGVGKKTTTAM